MPLLSRPDDGNVVQLPKRYIPALSQSGFGSRGLFSKILPIHKEFAILWNEAPYAVRQGAVEGYPIIGGERQVSMPFTHKERVVLLLSDRKAECCCVA